MIFRDKNGELVDIKRSDFYNDSEYYTKMMELKGLKLFSRNDNNNDCMFEKMNELINSGSH
jgi:hypothetical protein